MHALLTVDHLVAYQVVDTVGRVHRIHKVGIGEDAVAHGVGNIGATLTDDIGVGVIVEEGAVVLHLGLYFVFVIYIELQGLLVKLYIAFPEQLGYPFQRYVGCDNGIQGALLVVEWVREGGHHLLAATMVVVGLTPVILLKQLGYEVPVHIVVLIVGSA